jgi:hypothetical protein
MKKILVILSIMLLAIAACATTISPQEKTEGGSATTTKESVPADALSKLMQEVKDETLAKNDKSLNLVLPINIRKGSAGDNVVFGLNFNQITQPQGTYFATVTFVEGRDSSSNKIEVDKDTMRSWLRESVTSDFVLEEKGSVYLPVLVTIGDEIKPGVKTTPGSYQFEFQIHKRISAQFEEPVDVLVKKLFVKVE